MLLHILILLILLLRAQIKILGYTYNDNTKIIGKRPTSILRVFFKVRLGRNLSLKNKTRIDIQPGDQIFPKKTKDGFRLNLGFLCQKPRPST